MIAIKQERWLFDYADKKSKKKMGLKLDNVCSMYREGRVKMFISIEEILTEQHIIYAHVDKENKKRKETLKKHTELCQKYFEHIDKEKRLYHALDVMISKNFPDISVVGKKFFMDMFYNVVTFHDSGKCNPLFQAKKMKHTTVSQREFEAFGHPHSMLSATIYIEYFFQKLKKIKRQITKKESETLSYFLILNSYVIARHHSGLGSLETFLVGFQKDSTNGVYEAIEVLQEASEKIISLEIKSKLNEIAGLEKTVRRNIKELSAEQAVVNYTYERLLYSILVASDYYATTEFMNEVKTSYFGNVEQLDQFIEEYEKYEVIKSIRNYEKKEYQKKKELLTENNINVLRTELFLDAEKEWKKNKEENIFYLEAPTGSGKSNTALNLSFHCAKENGLGKIFYVYPFNTLVEQNRNTLKEIFYNSAFLLNKIAVVNSVIPIKCEKDKERDEERGKEYVKALLDRQFLNYPMILTTNVSLFQSMFGERQEDAFGFYQFMNSTIILDEVQNYKNLLWTEIITFLQIFAEILHIKIIIMSATLPDLNQLLFEKKNTVKLIENRTKYYLHPLFMNRVELDFHFLSSEKIEEELLNHIVIQCQQKKKILMEFIIKKSAEKFYRLLKERLEQEHIYIEIELMTGDDDAAERKRILDMTRERRIEENGMILVGTQVVEAGIDIDMDIGYKDISMLDSEEQFLGRINRACKKEGVVYFFQLDEMKIIYEGDYRVNKEMTLLSEEMRKILKEKEFSVYYAKILDFIKGQNQKNNAQNVKNFLEETVGNLDFCQVEERMKLIKEDTYHISVFLAREREDLEGNRLDGKEVWESYEKLLEDSSISYAEKMVKLSEVRSKMNYFIYQIRKDSDMFWDGQIGELYYIEEGEKFFQDGKLVREKLQEQGGLFID